MRKTAVNITIIGAGSAQFSGDVVRDLCVTPGLHGSRVTLMDVNEERLGRVLRLGEKLNRELDAGLTFTATTDREAALKRAEFVLNTAAVPVIEDSSVREVFQRNGVRPDGHLLFGLTQTAFHLGLARDMEAICPDAWLIMSANPVFEGCTVLTRMTRLKVLGLCHGHYGINNVCRILGLDPAECTAVMPGFNHHIYLMDFRCRGKNAFPLLEDWIAHKSRDYWRDNPQTFDDLDLSPAAVSQYQLYGALPIGDTPRDTQHCPGWWYNDTLEEQKRWYGRVGGFDSPEGWALYERQLAGKMENISRVVEDETVKATDVFPPVQSPEQIVPIINCLVNDQNGVFQVNIPNRGHFIPGFPEDLVVEGPGLVNGSGIKGVVQPPFPPKLMVNSLLPRWVKAERLVAMFTHPDPDLLVADLLESHNAPSYTAAVTAVQELLAYPGAHNIARLFPPMTHGYQPPML